MAEKGKECIWATNIRFLNDLKERDHCLGMIKDRLQYLGTTNWSGSGYPVASALSKIDYSDWHVPYVASFSMDIDSLPQWRAYCPNGNGVSIGFRLSTLRNTVLTEKLIMGKFPPPKATLEPIQYLADGDVKMVDTLLQECIRELEDFRKSENQLSPEDRTKADDEYILTAIFSRKCSLVKHASFESEKEYRLTAPIDIFGESNLHFRSSRTTVIPYKKLLLPEWGKSQYGSGMSNGLFNDYFIEQIMVGPTPNPDLTIEALSKLFLSRRVSPAIWRTGIPYRDL